MWSVPPPSLSHPLLWPLPQPLGQSLPPQADDPASPLWKVSWATGFSGFNEDSGSTHQSLLAKSLDLSLSLLTVLTSLCPISGWDRVTVL